MHNKLNDKENDAGLKSIEPGKGETPQTDKDETAYKLPLRKSVVRFVMAIVLSLAVIAVGAIVFVGINTYYTTSKQTDDYIKRTEIIETGIKTDLDNLNDKFALEKLNTFFTKDEVYSFAYNLWKYELLLNGKPVASTEETLTISPGDIISIKESVEETMLPRDFLAYGNLTRGDVNDSLKNHFSLSEKKYVLKEKKEKFSTTYTVEDVSFEKGEKFELVLSVYLQERLEFEKDVIPVTVK